MPPSLHCANSCSAAKLFVQLSARRNKAVPAASILDVLLPPQTQAFHVAARRTASPAAAATAIPIRKSNNGDGGGGGGTTPSRRRNAVVARGVGGMPFSTTSSWRRTQAIYNPQTDDDGNEMVMEMTPRAADRLSQIMAKDQNPHLALRIQVESGGCHGFQYLMSLTTLPPSVPASVSATPVPTNPSHPPDTSVPNAPDPALASEEGASSTTTSSTPSAPGVGEDDTVFAFVPEEKGDRGDDGDGDGGRTLAAGPKLVLDGPSLELLKGSKVDYTMELIGSQFKIVDNPHASSSCGCGTSFDIKA